MNDIKRSAWKGYALIFINILSLILLGLIMQIGGAYLVNAAVAILEDGAGAAATAAGEYSDYMNYIRSFEPRQMMHAIFVAPLVEELVFRLIFLRAGKWVLPFGDANIIQAVLFGVYHWTSFQRVYGIVMGLIIGCVFYYCPIIFRNRKTHKSGLLELPNSLIGVALTFLLHMTVNAAGLFVTPLFPADLPLAVQLFIGMALMAVAAAVCFVLFKQSAKEAVIEDKKEQ